MRSLLRSMPACLRICSSAAQTSPKPSGKMAVANAQVGCRPGRVLSISPAFLRRWVGKRVISPNWPTRAARFGLSARTWHRKSLPAGRVAHRCSLRVPVTTRMSPVTGKTVLSAFQEVTGRNHRAGRFDSGPANAAASGGFSATYHGYFHQPL